MYSHVYKWLPSLKLCKTSGRLNLAPGLKFAHYCFKPLNILGWPESSFRFFHNITEKPKLFVPPNLFEALSATSIISNISGSVSVSLGYRSYFPNCFTYLAISY